MKNFKRILVIFVIALTFTSNTLMTNASVKTMNKRLYPDKVYNSYDITGDNKKDRIVIKLSEPYYSDYFMGYKRLSIYVNKKLAYRYTYKSTENYLFDSGDENGYTSYSVRYIRLANNKKFIFFQYGDHPESSNSFLLEYKNKKLKIATKPLWALPNLSRNQSLDYLRPWTEQKIKVKNNSIIIDSHLNFNYMTVTFDTRVSYTYKKGKLRQATSESVQSISSFYDSDLKYLLANRKTRVYKDTKLTKKYFTIKKNQKVQFLRLGGTYKKYWFKVKAGKKTGYIKIYRQGEYSENTTLFNDINE